MQNLSAKELTGIEDQLGMEENLKAKYDSYSQEVQDIQLQQKFQQLSQVHQQHLQVLKENLE